MHTGYRDQNDELILPLVAAYELPVLKRLIVISGVFEPLLIIHPVLTILKYLYALYNSAKHHIGLTKGITLFYK